MNPLLLALREAREPFDLSYKPYDFPSEAEKAAAVRRETVLSSS
jgi:hypothetical protein